jgi:cytochrome b561
MQSPSRAERYTGVAMALHWVIAVLIGVNLVLVWFADKWPDGWVRPAIDLHKSIGITVLGLVLMRILWRFSHKPPAFPADYSKLERVAAHLAHLALYVLILAIPVSGWLHDSAWKDGATHPDKLFWLVPWPRISLLANLPPAPKENAHRLFFAFHQWLAYGLYALFFLHLAAALKHQWIDREPELQRMLPGGRKSDD